MSYYTVVLRYPDYLASDWPEDLYYARVKATTPQEADEGARREAAQESETDPDDFAVITVIAGWPAIYAGAEYGAGCPKLFDEGQG